MSRFIGLLLNALFVFFCTRKVQTIAEFIADVRGEKNCVSISVVAMIHTPDAVNANLWVAIVFTAKIRGTRWVILEYEPFMLPDAYEQKYARRLYLLAELIASELRLQIPNVPVSFDVLYLPGATEVKLNKETRAWLLIPPPKKVAALSVRRIIYIPRLARGIRFLHYSQSICFLLCSARYVFVLLKGLEPKKPLYAENGDGCGDSMTKCLVRSICAPFCLA